MDPNSIELENINKNFEYVKISREIDACDNLNELRELAKCYVKLHLKQQEIISDIFQ